MSSGANSRHGGDDASARLALPPSASRGGNNLRHRAFAAARGRLAQVNRAAFLILLQFETS